MLRRSPALLHVAGGRVPCTGAAERHALRPPHFQQIAIEEDRFERAQSERASASSRRDSCRECCACGEFFFSRESFSGSANGFGWTFNCHAGDGELD